MVPQPNTLERETVYSLLSDDTREYLLWYLSKTDRTTVGEAADRIAAWKRRSGLETADYGSKRDLRIQLHHDHVPRLEQYDVIDYDRSSGEIVPGPNFDDLEPYVADLDFVAEAR